MIILHITVIVDLKALQEKMQLILTNKNNYYKKGFA